MEVFDIGKLVIYKNNQLIAFNKPAALPAQPDQTGDKALFDLAEIYCKSTLYLIHRIDRPASGVFLLAKNKSAAHLLSEQFQARKISKKYLAVVKTPPPTPEGILVHFLKKDGKTNLSKIVTETTTDAQRAELQYKTLSSSDNYHLLEIDLITGRHHQIRAQLAAIGCPIKGDTKYGFKRSNPDRSIHLHAWKLGFHHPTSNEWQEITAEIPQEDIVWKTLCTQIQVP